MVETIVLGLDGANWELLDPWLRAGDLPNIAALRERGTTADSLSCLPPVTCPNWRCYSTGKNPGKLGVYWWETIDTYRRTLSTPTSRSFKSANYWDYLAVDGYTTGIVNLPMTYPPLPMEEGYLVAGGPGSEQSSYTTPPGLGKDLDARGYRVHPDLTVTSQSDEDAAADVVELIDERLATFQELLEERPVDVAHCTVFYINVLQHFFWRAEPTARAWKRIDDHIGQIRETYPDATLFLLSDHGCQDIGTVFYANTWLEREGLLKTTDGVRDTLDRVGINQNRILRLTDRLGLSELVGRLAPKWLKQYVPSDSEGSKRDQKLDQIVWSKSQAVASGQGLIYLLDESTEGRLIEKLSSLQTSTGTPVARSVQRRDAVYDGSYVDQAPHIVFDQAPGIHTSGAIGANPVFDDVSHWAAENVRTGLFLADGPRVNCEAPTEISITDIAPTILQSVGSPIPEDMDGTPLELFDGSTPTYRAPLVPEFVDQQSNAAVQDRLEDLGYLE